MDSSYNLIKGESILGKELQEKAAHMISTLKETTTSNEKKGHELPSIKTSPEVSGKTLEGSNYSSSGLYKRSKPQRGLTPKGTNNYHGHYYRKKREEKSLGFPSLEKVANNSLRRKYPRVFQKKSHTFSSFVSPKNPGKEKKNKFERGSEFHRHLEEKKKNRLPADKEPMQIEIC